MDPTPLRSTGAQVSSGQLPFNAKRVASESCRQPAKPWDSSRLATFTVSPQTS